MTPEIASFFGSLPFQSRRRHDILVDLSHINIENTRNLNKITLVDFSNIRSVVGIKSLTYCVFFIAFRVLVYYDSASDL